MKRKVKFHYKLTSKDKEFMKKVKKAKKDFDMAITFAIIKIIETKVKGKLPNDLQYI